jgi:hypothetical protein
MGLISNTGLVDIIPTEIFTVTGTSGTVISIRFNNQSAYNLILELYKEKTASTILIYRLALDAGDSVNDTIEYSLENGDKLIATCDITGTTYFIIGVNT